MKNAHSTSRRTFLKDTGLLIIGFSLLSSCRAENGGTENGVPASPDELPGSLADEPRIDSWLEVLEDGRVRIFTGKTELGQGIRIAITQVAAEELYTAPEMVEVHLAETGVTPNEGYTAGSNSIRSSAMSVRFAAAAAAGKLRALAAEQWEADAGQLTLSNGKVIDAAGGRELTFAEVLDGRQLEDRVQLPVSLKPKEQYQWVGRPVSRKDLLPMVTGAPIYVQDLRFPEMVYARVVRPAGYGATLQSFDESTLSEVGGLLKVVRNGSFLGLIAEHEHQAVKAQRIAEQNSRWSSPRPLPSDRELKTYLRELPSETQQVENKGSFEGMTPTLRASYFKPYIMHGAMAPSCAIAQYDGDELWVWTHSQGVYPLRESMQAMTGIPTEKIHIKAVPGAGCYGHNGADDVAADAALLAMDFTGRPVRLQYSRGQEHGWEPFGSAMIMELEAALHPEGYISHWRYDLWSDSHSTRPGGDPGSLLPARYLAEPFQMRGRGYLGGAYRNAPPYYTIPNLRIDAHFFEGPLRVSALRSLGAYANIFAIESFMDELAERAGQDPLTFRIRHSEDERSIAVLEKLRELTRNQSPGTNEGIGYGFSRYKNTASYCGVAVKLHVDPDSGEVLLQRMWGVIDAGEAVNPDGLKNQTEGGMVQSASWTLQEAVQFDEQHITSLDWNSYPVFRLGDTPEAEVVVIDRPDQPCLGAGEAAQGPTSAAIANAVYRASGKRVRSLPLTANL